MSKTSTSIALLRGINVGGKNKLPMKALIAMFEEIGCTDVRSYIQSGNVVFAASAALAKQVPALITASIEEQLELKVPLLTRSAAALGKARDNNPFAKKGAALESLHFGFLLKKPSAAKVNKLDPDRSPGDAFSVLGSEVYFHCPNGLARTKLTSAYFDKALDTMITVRNWKTVHRLIEMASE